MATGLFDTSSSSKNNTDRLREGDVYRSISGVAITSVVLAAMSPLSFLSWWLSLIPMFSLLLGMIALREIFYRPTELTGKGLTYLSIAASSVIVTSAVSYHAYVYATELPPGFQRLSYAMLQPLPGDPPTAVPNTAIKMDGRGVLIKGYMYPGKQQEGITQFLLVRDQGDCCFGGNPKITDRVLVTLEDGLGISFTSRMRKIAGHFYIKPIGGSAVEGGVLYHLEDAVLR
ncbi:MAG: hypothetical protein ABGW78_05835 [Pirellulales bacterium]